MFAQTLQQQRGFGGNFKWVTLIYIIKLYFEIYFRFPSQTGGSGRNEPTGGGGGGQGGNVPNDDDDLYG